MTTGWKTRDNPDAVGIGEKDGQRRKVGGLLVEIRTDVGENHSTVYDLVQKDGETLQVWGSTTIDGKLNPSDIGKFVKMKYLGMAKGKSGRDYKDIQVDVWEADLTDDMLAWPRINEFIQAVPEDETSPDAPEEEEDDDLPF